MIIIKRIMCYFFNSKMDVIIFTLQLSYDNKKTIDDLVKEFGNIPRYLELEGVKENNKGCIYLFCIDSSINYINIIEKYDYIYYNYDHKMRVNKKKYNNNYKIKINYFKNKEPYKLEKIK